MRVQLAPSEVGGAGDVRDERPVPRAGGVDDDVRGQVAAVGQLDTEPLALPSDRPNVYRPMDVQAELLLVAAEVLGDRGGRG